MNNYAVETRRRSRSLLVVEGKHEKDELFWLIFKCFPEMNIDIGDVWIYGTNIYKLYEDIVQSIIEMILPILFLYLIMNGMIRHFLKKRF